MILFYGVLVMFTNSGQLLSIDSTDEERLSS